MIKHFEQIGGRYIEKIIGQDRLAYSMSDSEDFYDLIEWSKSHFHYSQMRQWRLWMMDSIY